MNEQDYELIGESIWNTYTHIGQVLAEGILGAVGGALAGSAASPVVGTGLGAVAGHKLQQGLRDRGIKKKAQADLLKKQAQTRGEV